MADPDTLVLELTADPGTGDELVRVSTQPVAGSADIRAILVGTPERQVQFGVWIWNSRTESGVAAIEIANGDRRLDWLIDAETRDKPARILVGRRGQAFGAFTEEAKLVVDVVEATEERTLRVKFLAPDVALRTTWQTDFYQSSVPISTLEGRPVPVGLGKCFQAGAVLEQETPTIEYAVNIGPVAKFDVVASNANPALVTQYEYTERGFRFLITPAGIVTATFTAPQKQEGHTTADLPSGYPSSGHENAGANSDFTSWTSNKPTGYTLANDNIASPEKKLERYLSTSRLTVINRDSGFGGIQSTAPRFARNLGLIPGRWYGIRLDWTNVSGWTNQLGFLTIGTSDAADIGNLTLYNSTGELVTVQGPITADGTYYFKAGGPVLKVIFGGSLFTGTDTQWTLNSVRYWPVETGLTDLADLVPYVLDLAGWTGGIDQAGLDALSTAIGPHELGDYLTQTVDTADILDRLLAPFLGYWYVDETETIRFGRLVDPSTISGDPVLEITGSMIQRGRNVTVADDYMRGLTDTYGGQENHRPIDQETSAGAVATMNEQEVAAADFRVIARGDGTDLDPFYSWAHDRCIFNSRLQDETSIVRERDRTAAIAGQRRQFVTIPAVVPRQVAIKPGDKIRLTVPEYGFGAGVDLVVVGARRRYLGRLFDLLAWR